MDSSFTEIYDVLAAGLSEPVRQAYGLWKIALFHWFEIVLKSLFDVLNYLYKASTLKSTIKQRFNEFIEWKGNIRVFVRIRPLKVDNAALNNFTINSK